MNEREIFANALQEPSDSERSAYLDEACGEDSELRERIEALLREKDELGTFLESPAPPAITSVPPIAEQPGTVIGPYKLLEQIGEGGFGIVFMAQQEEPVRRKVALKIIKPGMDTKEVVARFEAERQALAMMDHPNIAKVFDAGATKSGRPYFVMDLIRGIPLTDYCDQNELTTGQRLGLFVVVCQAVQHAHQKGIIHRDIKPTNVLVTMRDGTPVPKVIDFGVAKATNQRLTEKTFFTRFAQMIGTPLYMSPEQAEMSESDVDTRSDIYSLGVLLYELLTGTTPLDKERMHKVAYDELLRIIREEEPPRPSLRLSTSESLAAIAASRQTEPKKLGTLVKGDLDWIVMKALEKDRTRRYETADGFAADIRRYLDDKPVEACPPTTTYRLRKCIRRNKRIVATSVLLMCVVLVGAGVSMWQAVRATRALRGEERQRERAEANLRLAIQALDELYLKSIGQDRLLRVQTDKSLNEGATRGEEQEFSPLERELMQRGLTFYGEFARQNDKNPQVLLETGKAYSLAGMLQSALNQDHDAQAAYEEAIARLKRLVELHPANSDNFLELGRAYLAQGQLSRWRPNVKNTFSEAEMALNRVIDLDPENVQAYRLRIQSYTGQAKYDKAMADHQIVVTLDPNNAAAHYEFAVALNTTQDAALRDYERALQHAKEAVRLAPNNPDYCQTLAAIYAGPLGDVDAAVAELERAIAATSELARKHSFRSRICELLKDDEGTIASVDKCFEVGGTHPALYLRRAKAYRRLGNVDRTIADLERAEINSNSRAGIHLEAAKAYKGLGETEKALAAYGAAEELDPNNSHIYEGRGAVFHDQGNFQLALTQFDKAVELAPRRSWLYKRRALVRFRLEHYDEALSDIAKAVEILPDDWSNLTWIPLEDMAVCPKESFRQGILRLSDKLIEMTNDAKEAHGIRLSVYAKFGREEEALPGLEASIARQRGLIDEFPEASEHRERWAEVRATLAHAHVCRGFGLWFKERNSEDAYLHFSKAITILSELVVDFPKEPSHRINLANAYKMRGKSRYRSDREGGAIQDLTEAISISRELVVDSPNLSSRFGGYSPSHLLARALSWRALLLMDDNKPDDAIADSTKAIASDPMYAEAYRHRADAYCRQGEVDMALADYRKALEINPEDTKAKDALMELRRSPAGPTEDEHPKEDGGGDNDAP